MNPTALRVYNAVLQQVPDAGLVREVMSRHQGETVEDFEAFTEVIVSECRAALRRSLQPGAWEYEVMLAMSDVDLVGNGFVHFSRSESGEITYRRLPPESVLLKDQP